jgi:hypothetical protein
MHATAGSRSENEGNDALHAGTAQIQVITISGVQDEVAEQIDEVAKASERQRIRIGTK